MWPERPVVNPDAESLRRTFQLPYKLPQRLRAGVFLRQQAQHAGSRPAINLRQPHGKKSGRKIRDSALKIRDCICRHLSEECQRRPGGYAVSARVITPATISTAPLNRSGETPSLSSRAPKYMPISVPSSRIGATCPTGARRMAKSTRM